MSVSKIEAKIKDLEQAVQAYNKNNIKLSTNGGNSILFMCPPVEESEYIAVLKKTLNSEKYMFLDMNDLLVKFVEENADEIKMKFDFLRNCKKRWISKIH